MRMLAVAAVLLAFANAAFAQADECEAYMMREHAIEGPSTTLTPAAAADYERKLSEKLAGTGGFCEAYQLGRFLIVEERYDEAIEVLEKVPLEGNSAFLCCNPLLNLLGFAHLKSDNLELAAGYFRHQTELPEFQRLSELDRMKTFNNLGYTLIQLGRYDEARQSLERAAILGSEKAVFNLRRIESLVQSLNDQDQLAPGAFATVVAYGRNVEEAEKIRAAIAEKLQVAEEEVQVFSLEGQRYYFTYGSYMSYPLAEERLAAANAAGIADAWVSLTSEWTDITQELAARD